MSTETIETVSGNDAGTDVTVSGGDAVIVTYNDMYTAVYDAVLDAQDAVMERQTVTDGQSISSAALSYFKGILGNQIIPKDYVIYVGDAYNYDYGSYGGYRVAYEYCMAVGDLTCDGTYISGTGKVYRYRAFGDVGVAVADNQSISLYAPLYYSRSNLGDYSGAIEYDWTGFMLIVMLMLGGLVWLIKKLMCLKY